MDIKWKKLISRPQIKLAAFALAIFCLFAGVFVIISRDYRNTPYYNDYNTQYIYSYDNTRQSYARNKLDDKLIAARTIALFKSEENILSREHLEITGSDNRDYNDYGERIRVLCNITQEVYYVSASDNTFSAVVASQLQEFRQAERTLASSGVDYEIISGGVVHSTNKPKNHLYSITVVDNIAQWETSDTEAVENPYNATTFAAPLADSSDTIYLGTNAVEYEHTLDLLNENQRIRSMLQYRLLILGLVGLLSVIVLTLGAGHKASEEEIQLSFMDKPYLDVQGVFLMITTMIGLIIVDNYRFLSSFTLKRPTAIVYSIIATIFFSLPALVLYLSFVRWVKKGRWWEHTLVYRMGKIVFNWVAKVFSAFVEYSLIIPFFIVLLGGGIGLLLILVAPPFIFIFAIFVAVIIGMHFFSLSKLQASAKNIESGNYQEQIPIKYGLFAPTARSLENISHGIDEAVEKQMKSERLKTDLITNVSHDIRTPLTSLITYSDLLKTQGLNSPDAEKYLDILIAKSGRLKQLTDDLFEATKATSGNIEVRLESLDLSLLINQYLGEIDDKISTSGLEFVLSLPPHAYVEGDGKLLWRVLENLFSNLFKYAMTATRVYLDLFQSGSYYQLDIKNISTSPLNISSNDLSQRFTRGDSSRSTEGSGLGLSIVESFIEVQGGIFEITVDGDLFKTSIKLNEAPVPTDYSGIKENQIPKSE